MKFINLGEPVQVRINEELGYRWELVKTNETIELPEIIGKSNNLTKMEITSSKIGNTLVETKQFDFSKEIESIKGIGKKTAKDITKVYPNRDKLVQSIKKGDSLPFRDDIEKKLKNKYGKVN